MSAVLGSCFPGRPEAALDFSIPLNSGAQDIAQETPVSRLRLICQALVQSQERPEEGRQFAIHQQLS